MLDSYTPNDGTVDPGEYDYQELQQKLQSGGYGGLWKKRSSVDRILYKKTVPDRMNHVVRFVKRRNNRQTKKQQEKYALKYFPILFA